jgi:hypothetical protein
MSPRRIAALVFPATLIAATVAAASGTTLKVTSSLDGKTVLPHRIAWMAYSTVPTAQIKEIDYLIDGKLRWVGHDSRSTYSDTGGYLVTSWLTPGVHKFTVRAVSGNGQTASDTVAARVLPAPVPPAALVGSWTRTINTSDAPSPGSPGNPTDTDTPSGAYTITFSRKWIEDHFPGKFTISGSINGNTGDGFELLTDWTPKSSTFHVAGAISIQPFDGDTDQLGGSWCYWGGPGADYTWKVTGTTLTLEPAGGADACSIRGFIWTGKWTKISTGTGRLP